MSTLRDAPDSVCSTFGPPIRRGRWQARLAQGYELAALQILRAQVFRGDAGAEDADAYDADSLHLWLGEEDQAPLATARLRIHRDAPSLLQGYTAQAYDLTPLLSPQSDNFPMIELGRLCAAPQSDRMQQAEVMRLLWAAVARMVLRSGAGRLIGCTSFQGADPAPLTPALTYLAARHLGPDTQRPKATATEAIRFTAQCTPSLEGQAQLPTLLRAYLAMGGWVSDHLVIDRALDTCHVFTCLDIAAMPAPRKRALTALAEGAPDL
ncbi:GNAT family N-acyltransferase [Pararhodobacter oceanensis]|uniref:L-ornithine N(alpha)-acyltransferase n=1 Tax=Pararhodobacter oceanensis TaxID=2172121 RepID=A0A2T8HTQ3_9RHOB|nr:GNAT family N-acyltransferase [Pararhodobacter oceanensis]PVH28712.1 ornithine-acyl-ACP acyltransferase [Pararhodobacter oceanensis]